ncbi:MAG: succinate dehydrogenase [Flavobacterium sp.]|uniref:succinate dehydrogenase cytochrome b subunit n=1 Tax=Flavobacterium sp. TaxID=239 RepID=UPI000C425A54|nr:succinate dehydrogenase cytochrome b subunit [Flavobacterium sp.]MBF02326.1 succinate dehydrogenase [Flavobacterium sp.]|tara:strand:+ start:1390 stop:2259 length:870 start_codon:yes stop_codon:yes gene_type:complete
MAKSALLKSSIAKKYWMALTGLFLCLFLAGHLAGNLQLLVPNNALNFNQYALFMTTNPAVKVLSYLTYISILFHAIDGFLLTYQNAKARPIGYAKSNPSANSSFSSRNMALLGTIVLVFIVTHMVNFWAKMHFDKNMPLMTQSIESQPGMKQDFYVGTQAGQYYPVEQVEIGTHTDEHNHAPKQFKLVKKTELYYAQANVKAADLYKDLYKITLAFFRDAKYGLYFTIGYVLAMFALGFHLWHGFQSAFQSLGLNSPKYTPLIKFIGKAFAVIVPLLFAIIPLYIHFTK